MASSPLTLASFPRAILHVDADCCFASIEQSRNPQYRGKPLITGKERGIVASMSLEARALGITRGMRLFEVKRLCPDVIILPSIMRPTVSIPSACLRLSAASPQTWKNILWTRCATKHMTGMDGKSHTPSRRGVSLWDEAGSGCNLPVKELSLKGPVRETTASTKRLGLAKR